MSLQIYQVISSPCNRHELFLQMTNIHMPPHSLMEEIYGALMPQTTQKSIKVRLYYFLNKAIFGHSLVDLNASIRNGPCDA